MIELVNVSKIYDDKSRALKDVNLTVYENETLGIVGESGSGKSTLLRLIHLMEQPTSGDLLFKQTSTLKWTKKDISRQKEKMSMLFQHFNLLSNLTVLENILLPLKLQKRLNKEKALSLLEFVGLKDKANSYPSQLSGGQKQRVALARALITEPQVLLLDEATSALDIQTTEEILRLLDEVKRKYHPTIVFVSHDLEVIKKTCDRVLVMEKGEIVAESKVSKSKLETEGLTYKEKAIKVLSS